MHIHDGPSTRLARELENTPTKRALFAAAVLEWWWTKRHEGVHVVAAALRMEKGDQGPRLVLPQDLEQMPLE